MWRTLGRASKVLAIDLCHASNADIQHCMVAIFSQSSNSLRKKNILSEVRMQTDGNEYDWMSMARFRTCCIKYSGAVDHELRIINNSSHFPPRSLQRVNWPAMASTINFQQKDFRDSGSFSLYHMLRHYCK